jgi:hypothetical protein
MSIKHISFTGAVVLISTLFTACVINCANAKNIAIYRWVDKNNEIHFSQNLPQENEHTELSTVTSFKVLSKRERKILADSKKATEAAQAPGKQQDNVLAKNKDIYDKNCKSSKLNIKMLDFLDEIHISEEKKDGSFRSRTLTTAEKEEKMALSKKHVDIYCSK